MRRAGFTLLEVVIALAITGLLSLAAYRLTEYALSTRQKLQQREMQFRALQDTLLLMHKDFTQMVPCSGAMLLALRSPQQTPALFTFCRGDWSPGTHASTQGMALVRYVFENGVLMRHLGTRNEQGLQIDKQRMVAGLQTPTIEFLRSPGTVWIREWPQAPASRADIPVAARVSFTHDTFGSIEQQVLVGGIP